MTNTSPRSQRGFTVIELTIVLIVSSLLLVPLLKLAFSSVGGNRDQQTEAAFEKAVDALIAYADEHNGCLPFAADFEGGLPDTDLAGDPLTDTGVSKVDQRAGDLPWADLGLLGDTSGGFFRDGDFLRVQYYVAFNYADAGSSCGAGYRGQEWNPQVQYSSGSFVYVTLEKKPKLYKITGTLAPGAQPKDAADATEVSKNLKNDLLRVRRGPDITADANGQKDDISKRNVFVLIAVGNNRNAALNRQYMRDANHVIDKDGSVWNLGVAAIDKAVFSMTHDESGVDHQDDGDDTLRIVSFLEYKSRLQEFGMIMQPICQEDVFDVDCKE